ncbi:MAG: hypothetical protein WBD99_10795 [Thermodesulfobacteriota bacterium]
MATVSITSNEGTLDSASAVLEVTATNPKYNQPALREDIAPATLGLEVEVTLLLFIFSKWLEVML